MLGNNDLVDARVTAFRDLTPTIREFVITPAHRLAASAPGSHILVEVAVNGRSDRRSYSVVGHTDGGDLLIAVKRVEPGRGGSRWMFTLQPGDALRISAPRNNFPLSIDSATYLLIAGGIGITPLRGMAKALSQRGSALRLVYAVRTTEELAFFDELHQELGSALATFVDERGESFDLATEFAALPDAGEAYVCGPHSLLKAAQRVWSSLGRDPTRLRYETFGAGGGGEQRPFVARLAALDREIPVAAGQTMLDAMEEAGIAVLSGCRKGECGLCVLEVVELESQLEHRDVFLSEAQHVSGRSLCVCVSRATGGRVTVRSPHRPDTAFVLDQKRGLAWNGVPIPS